VRNIISLLPQQKYGSIIIILHNMEDLSQMTSTLLIDKIVAFEMSRKMGQEEPTSSRLNDFACDEHKKMKGKKKVESSSFSSEEEKSKEENGDEKDDPPSTSSFEDEEIA
jgi:ABC-type multidrug transport system ATPase subunit